MNALLCHASHIPAGVWMIVAAGVAAQVGVAGTAIYYLGRYRHD